MTYMVIWHGYMNDDRHGCMTWFMNNDRHGYMNNDRHVCMTWLYEL